MSESVVWKHIGLHGHSVGTFTSKMMHPVNYMFVLFSNSIMSICNYILN